MKKTIHLGLLLCILLSAGMLKAQSYPLQISVVPKVTYFPPYIGEYVDDPYRFFDVFISNVGFNTQQIYLGIRLEMISPPDFTGTTPADRPPAVPLGIASMQNALLVTPAMWDQLLGHLSENDIETTGINIEDYRNGLALLPEGQYRACITAYNFNAAPGNPEPLSDPETACAFFTICYSATAPVFTSPVSCVDENNPILAPAGVHTFTWTPPVYNCAIPQFTYQFNLVELLENQDPETALEFNPSLFTLQNLSVPLLTLDTNLHPGVLQIGKSYAIRVRAENQDMSRPVMLTNDGASPACTFTYGDTAYVWTDPGVQHDTTPSTITDCFAPSIANTTPYSGTLDGRRVTIGHFIVSLTSGIQNPDGTWRGHGHLNWMPFGDTVRIKVEFSNIRVNTVMQVYDGEIYATANTELDNYIPQEIRKAKAWADKAFDYASALGVGAATNPYHQRMQGYYDMLQEPARVISQLANGAPSYLPITVRSIIPSSPIDVGIIGMCLTPSSAKMNTMAVFDVPESLPGTNSKWLAFVGQGMCFTPDQLVYLDEGALFLAADFNVQLPAEFDLTFKRATVLGDTLDGCFIKWDNSGFRQARIQADMSFPSELKPEDGAGNIIPGKRVKATFSAHFRAWNDWIATATVVPFQIQGIPSFSFTARDLVYDHSATQNAAGMQFPEAYPGAGNSWTGFYIKNIGIALPADFKTFNESDQRTRVEVENMLVDDFGVTSDIQSVNLIDLSTGNLGGWAFSLDTLRLKIWQSSFNQAWIAGKLLLPISETPLGYRGELRASGDELDYSFSLKPASNLEMSMWLARLTLERSSGFSIEKDSKGMAISCLLHGELGISSPSSGTIHFAIPEVHFENFGLGNRNPATQEPDFYLSLGTWSVASPQKTLGPFNVNYEFPEIVREGASIVGLRFSVGFGILTFFNCNTKFDVLGKLTWSGLAPPTTQFHEVRLDEVSLSGGMNPVYVEGRLKFYYNDTIYGSGIKGRVNASFVPLVNVQAVAQFGKVKTGDSYDYWYVDARAAFNPGIEAFPLAIGGFGGGVWYNMEAQNTFPTPSAVFMDTIPVNLDSLRPDKSVTGIVYAPKKNSWGLKAGVIMTLSNLLGGGHVMNGSVWLSCQFKSGSFKSMTLTGDMYTITDYPANKNPLAKALLNMGYDFEDHIFNFNLNVSASMLGFSTTIPMAFWADIDDEKWFLKLGDPHGERMRITIFDIDEGLIKGHLGAEAYLALGNALDNTSLPPIPQIITDFLNVDLAKYRADPEKMGGSRKGMLFGAKVDGELDINLILYAHLEAIAGFDVAMYHDENNNCDGKPAGYNGWYGNGQIYGYFDGDIGIKIDVWFFKGSVSLARLTAGALLIGGMPDPFWAYGKVKVRGSILGGLIKVSTSLEMEVGEPCYPGSGNPLENIRILEEITPGYATFEEAGQYDPESVFVNPVLTSNIDLSVNGAPRFINLEIPPNERNKNVTYRTYVFYLDTLSLIKGNTAGIPETAPEIPLQYTLDPNNRMKVTTEREEHFTPNVYYKIKAVATAKQYYPAENKFDWPEIDGTRQRHREEMLSYFRTGPLPDFISREEILLSMPMHRQRFFFRSEDYFLSLAYPRPDLFSDPERRIESWISQAYDFNGYTAMPPQKINFSTAKVIRFYPNTSLMDPEMVYTLAMIRINEAKEQEFLQKLAVERRRQVIHNLLSNQVITQTIGTNGLVLAQTGGGTITGAHSGLQVQQPTLPGATVPGTSGGGLSRPGLRPGVNTASPSQTATVQQLWNEALAEHDKKYKKDTLDYRQMALTGKYDMGFLDTLFVVTFKTSRHKTLAEKLYAYRKLIRYTNAENRSEFAAEPFEYADIYGYPSTYAINFGYSGAIRPLLDFRERFSDNQFNDDHIWKTEFFDLIHLLDDNCMKASFKPRPNISKVENVEGLSLNFLQNTQMREISLFPLGDRQAEYYFPNRNIGIKTDGSLSGPYFLNHSDVAGPLSKAELKGPSSGFNDAKIKYRYNQLRNNLSWDMTAITSFYNSFKSHMTQFEATNGAGRDRLSQQWIDEGRYITGTSVTCEIKLPIYQFVYWHAQNFVIYQHFRSYTPPWEARSYSTRKLWVFRLDPEQPDTYKTTGVSDLDIYY